MNRTLLTAIRSVAWATVWLAVGGIDADAHHSIAAVYDGSRQVMVEGVVTEFAFINPHPYLTIAVRDGTQSAAWRLEMDNRFELAGIGMDGDTFKPGDRVVVAGSPGRTQERALYIRRLDRPADGFRYEQVGTRPEVRKCTADSVRCTVR